MRIIGHPAAARAGLAAALVLLAAPAFGTSPEGENAVWTPKELNFIYMGFTSHYSCDGLRDRVREALLALGARKDLQVSPYGCTAEAGRPDPFPGVHIRMNVLAPPAAGGASAAAGEPPTTVAAQWKKVDVRLGTDALDQGGNCELIEQIKQKILPLFTVRNVEFASNCVPKQLSAGGTWLRAEVLTPEKDDKTLASK